MFPNNLQHLQPNQEVAVMPMGSEAPHEVLTIAKVKRVGRTVVQTHELGSFTIADGGDENLGRTLYIEPATDDHRVALRWKRIRRGER